MLDKNEIITRLATIIKNLFCLFLPLAPFIKAIPTSPIQKIYSIIIVL